MTIHLGTDLVYIPRIQATLDRFGERFLQRVYTLSEQQDYKQRVSQPETGLGKTPRSRVLARTDRAAIHYLAGRWAAKEAVAKALGTGFAGVRYTDIEIQRLDSGVPQVQLSPTLSAQIAVWGRCCWQLSLSHDRDYCIAVAIAVCTPFKEQTEP
ncbi:MAG: holo-ACP synthase [Desertifilum sp. SIO1I2]|nr:holo-ACP synthase [Desertifilum sp. SIO1I2]